jgi:hypothetical protein
MGRCYEERNTATLKEKRRALQKGHTVVMLPVDRQNNVMHTRLSERKMSHRNGSAFFIRGRQR